MESNLMNINEKLVPILANKGGKPGIAFKNTETGEVSGWTAKGDITPDQRSKLDPYFGSKGKGGYKLDPQAFKRSVELQKKYDIDSQPPIAKDQPLPKGDVAVEPKAEQPAPKPKVEQPAPKPEEKPRGPGSYTTADYQKAAAAARKSGDPKAMASARDIGMDIWARKYKKTLAPKVVTRQDTTDVKQSGYPVIKKYTHPSVEESKMETYDLVLEYLLSEGHAETVEEAHYVMMQLDSEYVQSIVEAGLPIPHGGIKPDRLNPIDPATGKSMYKVVPGASGKPKEIRNPSFGKLPPA